MMFLIAGLPVTAMDLWIAQVGTGAVFAAGGWFLLKYMGFIE